MIRWKSWSLPLPLPVPLPVPLTILLLLLISLIATSIHAAETETYTDIQSHAETLMEGQAAAQAAAEASMYSQAPSIEGRLYHNYLETSASSSSSSSSSSYNEDDAYAQGQAEMQAWIKDIKQEIASARTNNIVDASFLESDNEGETFSSAQSGAALSATIEQQMNEQLDGEIHGMTQQEIEQQAQIVEMLAADAADAAEMGEQDPSDFQFVETNADVDQQHHMDVHESLRESMNTDAGMEALHELAMDKAREAAVKRAETWLQDGLDTSDTSAIETDSHTNIDTELDMILGADATAEQLAAQEARIWESMDAESKMVARASMAIDTLLTHTAEIHAMNEGATTILDHLISNGWLHQGIESFNDVNEEFDMNEIEMEQPETQATTILTSCSLSASNHLRAPTSCSCPSPSIMVTCTTDAPFTYHTNILDITDRITTLRTLIAEIQQVLSKSQNVMLEIQEHMEMFKDG